MGYIFAPATAGEPRVAAVSAAAVPVPSVVAGPASIAQPRDEVLAPAPRPTASQYQPYNAFLYIPTYAQEHQPLQVVIALHGMGGEGKSFSATMIKEAERNNWLLVAPTIDYGDWHNPDAVVVEDVDTTRRLNATIDGLPARTGLTLKPGVDIYGFSRGAQLAHRFAIFFPERVNRVVAFSAGTYTLPYGGQSLAGNGRADAIPMPYGVSDIQARLGRPLNPSQLRQVRFLIGVGGADTVAGDVPRQWDEYLGKTRVERATEFTRALQRSGVPCSLKVFPAVGHEFTQPMLTSAVTFFSDPSPAANPLLQ